MKSVCLYRDDDGVEILEKVQGDAETITEDVLNRISAL